MENNKQYKLLFYCALIALVLVIGKQCLTPTVEATEASDLDTKMITTGNHGPINKEELFKAILNGDLKRTDNRD